MSTSARSIAGGSSIFLASLDVLAVPTAYQEPKGLFVLEALAAGVPVVQPDHGAFPEVLAETQGGLLHRPEDAQHLAERLHELLTDAPMRQRLAIAGRQNVHTSRNAREMAIRTESVLRDVMEREKNSDRESLSSIRASAIRAESIEGEGRSLTTNITR